MHNFDRQLHRQLVTRASAAVLGNTAHQNSTPIRTPQG